MADGVVAEELDDLRYLGGVFAGVEAQFRDLDYTETLRGFMPVLQQEEARQFSQQADAAGRAWPKLSPVTIARKGHDRILVETGRLRASLESQNGDSVRATSHRGLLFGTAVPYSIFHQTGGRRLPQREHVGMNSEACDKLTATVADATVRGLKATV